MSSASVQFYEGIITERTAAGGLPPAVRYGAVVVHSKAAIQLENAIPACRITDDNTELIAADLFSKCEIQVGPDLDGGNPRIRLYVKEGIPFDPCKQGVQGQQDPGGGDSGGGFVGVGTGGVGVGFGGGGGFGAAGGPSASSGGSS